MDGRRDVVQDDVMSADVVSCPYMIYYPTVMARYSLFVLKVSLNPKQTNKQIIAFV